MGDILIDRSSLPSTKSELNLYTVPQTQVAIKKSYYLEVSPNATVTSEGPWAFIHNSGSGFLDLSKSFILWKGCIKTAADGDLAWAPARPEVGVAGQAGHQDAVAEANPNQRVGPVNMIGNSIFKQVKLFLNNKLVSDSSDTYAYTAYLQSILNYDRTYKNTMLVGGAGWDVENPFDQVDTNGNLAWQLRTLNWRNSDEKQFIVPIHMDLMNQEKLLINKINLKLELHRNPNAFCLMHHVAAAGTTFRMSLNDIKLYLKVVEPVDAVSLALESSLMKNTLKYPIRRTQIKTLSVAAGRRDLPSEPVFTGQIPRRLVVAFVDEDAFHGVYNKSPFNFKNFNISEIQVMAGGVNYPPNPIQTDFPNDHYKLAYAQLFEAMGQNATKHTCEITAEEFKNGTTLFVFDLTQSSSDDESWELIREGATTIKAKFDADIPAGGIKMICLGEFDNLLTVDRFRNCFADFTV